MHHLALLALATSFAAPALAQLRVLYQNDLSFNASTSALLILQDTPGSDAASACAGYSEQLLSSVNSDIEDQLKYLVYTGELQNSSRLHLGGGSSSPALRFARRQQESCNIYNVGVQFVSSGNCSEPLVSTAFLPVRRADLKNLTSSQPAGSMYQLRCTLQCQHAYLRQWYRSSR